MKLFTEIGLMYTGVGGEAVEGGAVGAGEQGSSDLRVEGDAALQPARAGEPQERRRRAQEVRSRQQQQIVDACMHVCMMYITL